MPKMPKTHLFDENEKVGNRIALARSLLSVTQTKLARLVETSQGALTQIERGIYDPGHAINGRIAEVLGLSVRWVIGGIFPISYKKLVFFDISKTKRIENYWKTLDYIIINDQTKKYFSLLDEPYSYIMLVSDTPFCHITTLKISEYINQCHNIYPVSEFCDFLTVRTQELIDSSAVRNLRIMDFGQESDTINAFYKFTPTLEMIDKFKSLLSKLDIKIDEITTSDILSPLTVLENKALELYSVAKEIGVSNDDIRKFLELMSFCL